MLQPLFPSAGRYGGYGAAGMCRGPSGFSQILDRMDLYPHYESLFLVYLFNPCITNEILEMINCGASSLPDRPGLPI